MKIKLLIFACIISLNCFARLYVNEYLANTTNLKDTRSKVEQWFNDQIRPGKFEGTSRMTELKKSINEYEVNKIIDTFKNKSFKDLAEFHQELKNRVIKRAKDLAEDRIRIELSLSLNDKRFNQLNLRERSGITQKIGEEINIQKLHESSAYDILSKNSTDTLKDKLSKSAWNNYGKDCSTWYSVTPSAPPYSYKEQQAREKGKKIVQDLKDCKLEPHCWAIYSMYKNGDY